MAITLVSNSSFRTDISTGISSNAPIIYPNDTFYSLQLLEELELQIFLKRHIPVTVYLILLCLVGTVGNIHAIVVYSLRYSQSNYRTFVVWLAFVDLAACCLSIPFEVYDIRNGYTFQSDAACKLFRFLNHLVSSGSGFLLGVIAIERFRKVCRPFARQLTERESKMACVITIAVAALLSLPSFVLYGPTAKETGNPSIMGSDCTVLARYKKSLFFKIYNGALLFLSTGVFIVCVVVYIMVGRVLYQSTKFRNSAQVQGMKKSNSSSSSNLKNMHCEPSVAHEEESSTNGNTSKISRSLSQNEGTTVKKRKKFDRMKRITMMFLVATAVSYIGYLPNLLLVYLKAFNGRAYDQASEALGPLNSILLRGYFINNVTNPIVYCFLDDRFRRECKVLYRKLKCLSSGKICDLKV